ncbi:MAG: ABC transporter permease [Candidatus Acidiferrum sp.]
MSWIQTIWLRLQRLFFRERFSRDLDKEMQFHLEQQIAENLAAGMTPEVARRAAHLVFGNGTTAKEDAWEAWGWVWLEQIAQDIRYGLRQLRKTPGFTATAVLTLALGIGANAAIFTLVHAVMLNNLPVADPRTLVRLGNNNDCCVNGGAIDSGNYTLFSTASYELLKKNVPEFQELAALQAGFAYRPVIARRDGTQENAQSVMGEFVSGNYFRTFGLRPAAGRLLADDDDRKGAPMIAVLSYDHWKNTYGGDPSIVGSTFWINTKAVTIAGIAPAGFYGDRLSSTPPDFYLPIETMPVLANVSYVHDPDARWLYIIGREKPGVSLAALQQKVSALVKQSLAETKSYSDEQSKKILPRIHVVLTPGGSGIQDLREQYESNLKLLMVASGLVLLIACANIANLLLVRGMRRKGELSVRTALGAARGRIVRQLLTESVVLSVLGGIAGLIVAYLGTHMILKLAFPGAQNVPIDARPSPVVLGFTCALVLLTGILFGIAPAWIAAKTDPGDALRSGGRGTTSGASLLQRGLVVVQTALSLLLLVGAGLFSRTLGKLESTDLKLDSNNRYIVHINPQAAGYSQTQLEALYRTIEQRFHSLPGVTKVGLSTYTPMEDDNWGNGVQIQGQPDTNSGASLVKISPEYFDSVGTKVVMGRSIGPQDTLSSPAVAVVNEEFVKGFFPKGENPIGRRFGSPGPQSSGDYEIVVVVNDTAYTSVEWTNHRMYFPALPQRPASDQSPIEDDGSLYAGAMVVQTSAPINNMEQLARETLAQINPNLAVVKFQTFADQIADRFNEARLVVRLIALFGALALLLATIGLYVTSYTVARRTSEIGIRMALGAERSSVVAMIMRGALGQTGLGLAIGIPVALLYVRAIQAKLYGMHGANLGVLAAAVLALALASALAGLIPASRAASTDPAQTLRAE